MAFRVSGLVTVDGKQAKAELKSTGEAAKKAGRDITSMGRSGRTAAAGVQRLSGAERQAARDATGLATSSRLATGSLANLTAQFNDIGVMMAAGQSPLQLAMQQGTQVTQVIGPMGAAGAAKALGSAFLSMMSPINIVTIGAIAAGAAMTQWLFGVGKAAETVEDRIEAMGDAVEAFDEKATMASLSLVDMVEKFGTADPVLRAVLADIAALGKLDAYKEIDRTAESLRNMVQEAGYARESLDTVPQLLFLGLDLADEAAGRLSQSFGRNLRILEQSEDPARRLAAALALRDQLRPSEEALKDLTEDQREFYDGLVEIIQAMRLLGVRIDEHERGLVRNADLVKQAEAAIVRAAKEREKDAATAGEMLVHLREQAAMQQAIALFGRESVQVRELEQEAARRELETKLEALQISETQKEEIRAALELLFETEGQTALWATTMAGVAAEVRGILSALASIGGGVIANASKAVELEALKSGKTVADARMAAAQSQIDMEYKARDQAASNWVEKAANWADREVQLRGLALDQELALERAAAAKREADANRGRRGAARATDRERDAVARLLQRQREQLAIIRETDPVQKEMIRNRETLAAATEGEREEVERLIQARMDEEAAIARNTEMQEYFGTAAIDALDAMTEGGGRARDAVDALGTAIRRAALEALVLGKGPLANLFGTSGDGGLFGMLWGAVFPGAGVKESATGEYIEPARPGMVYGPGTGTSDEVLRWVSAGEMIVNAKATARNRALLEAINSGKVIPIPGMATGGMVGGTPQGGVGAAAMPGRSVLEIRPSPLLDVRVWEEARNVSIEVVQEFERSVLPDSVARIQSDPWRRG